MISATKAYSCQQPSFKGKMPKASMKKFNPARFSANASNEAKLVKSESKLGKFLASLVGIKKQNKPSTLQDFAKTGLNHK